MNPKEQSLLLLDDIVARKKRRDLHLFDELVALCTFYSDRPKVDANLSILEAVEKAKQSPTLVLKTKDSTSEAKDKVASKPVSNSKSEQRQTTVSKDNSLGIDSNMLVPNTRLSKIKAKVSNEEALMRALQKLRKRMMNKKQSERIIQTKS